MLAESRGNPTLPRIGYHAVKLGKASVLTETKGFWHLHSPKVHLIQLWDCLLPVYLSCSSPSPLLL